MNPDSFHAENPQTAVESGDAWQRLVDAIRSEVSAVFAAHGLEFRGELRGVLQEPGRPETANGLGLEFGGGLPPGWKKT